MSYCRNNGTDSDVYVIGTARDTKPWWECVACSLSRDRWGYLAKNRVEMLLHLDKHRIAGDKVPARAIERLEREIQELDGPRQTGAG